ncbi:MAG: hypothetical protein Q9160_006193 [Pyrenula sp. 1 TL-2023]
MGWDPERCRAPSSRGLVDTECKAARNKEEEFWHQDPIAEKAAQSTWTVICNSQTYNSACVKKLEIVCDQNGYKKRALLPATEYVEMANHPCVEHCQCFDLVTGEWMVTEKMECVSKEKLSWLRAMPAVSPS